MYTLVAYMKFGVLSGPSTILEYTWWWDHIVALMTLGTATYPRKGTKRTRW
jgi:hypothetical protein